MTRTQESTPARDAENVREARRIEAQLDAALEDSFPASDPVSIVTSQTEEYWRAADTPAAEQDKGRPEE
jgi:hypothetical protein